MTQESGAAGRGGRERRSRADRLLGGAAEPAAPRTPAERGETPVAVRRAALVVGLEAVLLLGGALVLLYLTLTSSATSVSNAVAEVVYVALFGGVMAAAAVGLWRVSPWARGPVVVLQLILAALGYTTAFEAGRPELGIPVLALAAVELYLLATPEARLAYLRASGE
ncbi:hypothetical protein [Blastococcus sp. TF02A-26]|uniref:hypothetical protein n=1 Tax=Blastococcus sp. TF02A-26 TaxID=2250577 RepID=UPI000DEBE1F6|nr:hypothetical protein [Blastococcus sp. TF02A-26]RBY84012.1 hypothetical protein DQ240_16305 [Blastococcus sp. TF02A-26]